MRDPTRRFSERVADYVRYRPGYPDELVQTLERVTGLSPGSVVADIGSGTGISSELFLRIGCTVFAVEPNDEMRAAAEERLGEHERFRSVPARAEETDLDDGSIDLIACGQAFHWFDVDQAREEFRRILRPGGWLALFWNSRRTDTTPFLRDYEALLDRFAIDYRAVRHERIDSEVFERFFAGRYEHYSFPSTQTFDLEGLRGRVLSSSYIPLPGRKGHQQMLEELDRIFDLHQSNAQVHFDYDTELFLGRL